MHRLAIEKAKDSPSRPIQIEASWTFDLALALLKAKPLGFLSEALDAFLTNNEAIFSLPYPFSLENHELPSKITDVQDLKLRNVIYSGITSEDVEVANKVSDLLDINPKEALRIIIQTRARYPKDEPFISFLDSLSRLPDEIAQEAKQSVIQTFVSAVLVERRTILLLLVECFNSRFDKEAPIIPRKIGTSVLAGDSYIIASIGFLNAYLKACSSGTEDPVQRIIASENSLYAIQLAKFLFELILNKGKCHKDVVWKWFTLMQRADSASLLSSGTGSLRVFEALLTLISLELLEPKHDFAVQEPTFYLDDPKAFMHVNEIIIKDCCNDVIKYSWLLLSHKKSIILEEYGQANSSFLAVVSLSNVQTSISNLRSSLLNSDVFKEISELHKLLSFDDVFSVTLCDLLVLAMPLITVTDDIARCYGEVFSASPNYCVTSFFTDSECTRHVTLARAKFPYSISPFICFSAINGKFAFQELKHMKSFLYEFSKDFAVTEYEIDSDNTDLIKTTSTLDVCPPFECHGKLSFVVEAGTKAKVIEINDETKNVVMFLHDYNGWTVLGRVLENICKSFDATNAQRISILTDFFVLLERVCEQVNESEIKSLLEYLSVYIDDSDIVDLIFRIFEQSIHNRCLDLSVAILRNLICLMPFVSQRIWSYLSVSSLIPFNGKEALIKILFSTVESKRGDYKFTISLVKFIITLAENCLSNSTDYPEMAKSNILTVFVKHLNFVLESTVSCKFNDGRQKIEIGLLIFSVFSKILGAVNGIALGLSDADKPTKVFSAASSCIFNSFFNNDYKVTRSAELIFQLIDLLASSEIVFEANDPTSFLLNMWIESAFTFTGLLLSVKRSSKVEKISSFEKQLFAKLPKLVEIYLRKSVYRKAILSLLTTLMSGVSNEDESPSMLSHLGPKGAKILSNALATDLSNSFDEFSIKISIYDFLCALMEAGQHGLSALLISGKDVFGEFTASKKTKKASQINSLLPILKKNVTEMSQYPQSVTVHLLDTIALALNSRTTERKDDSDAPFLKELIAVLSNYKKPWNIADDFDYTAACYECKTNSKIAEVLSLVQYSTNNEELKALLSNLLTNDTFAESLARVFQISDYNSEIYQAVHCRFENLYPSYKLTQFTNSAPKRNRYGVASVYNLTIMDSIFGRDPEWPALRQQIIACSDNIQYYNAQIALSKSYGALLATFCSRTRNQLTSLYFDLIPYLLTIKDPIDTYTSQFCSQQYIERTELSFYICYALHNNPTVAKKSETVIAILGACVDLLETKYKSHTVIKGKPCELRKALLRIIYLVLTGLKGKFDGFSSNMHVFENLFDLVISQGTTNIIIELQNDVYLSRTKSKSADLSGKLDYLRLILSTLKVMNSFNMIPSSRSKLLDSLVTHGTIQGLRSLYSFSHLILVNDNPVFAQLSLMFTQLLMLEESFMRKYAGSELFIVMRESVISQPLREGGITITNAPHIHQTWTNGILPILVTCLAKRQNLNEVLLTLQVFAYQIEFCIDLWARDSSSLKISSACVLETTQIMYIYQFLNFMAPQREFKAHSSTEVCTDVDMPLIPGLETAQKRDDFVNYIANLLKHPKFLVSRIVPSSVEEKTILRANDTSTLSFVENLIDDIRSLKEFLD